MALLKQKINGVWTTIPLVNKLTIDSAISDTSAHPVQNKVIKEYIDNFTRIYAQPDEPTNPKEGDVWIDTDEAAIAYAEGVNF